MAEAAGVEGYVEFRGSEIGAKCWSIMTAQARRQGRKVKSYGDSGQGPDGGESLDIAAERGQQVVSHRAVDEGQVAVRVEEAEAAAIRPMAEATVAAARGVSSRLDCCQSQANNISSRAAAGRVTQDSRRGAKQQRGLKGRGQ